jgi:hypothetical protein
LWPGDKLFFSLAFSFHFLYPERNSGSLRSRKEELMPDFNVVVIGAGNGGLTSALPGQKRLKVLLLKAQHPGQAPPASSAGLSSKSPHH